MSERKNIDRLFQEKFKDFEASPADNLWNDIEARLDKKKRKRVIPFWWKLSGVAAVFLIGFLVGKTVLNNKIEATSPIIVTDHDLNKSKSTNAVSEKNGLNGSNSKSGTNPDVVSKKGTTNSVAPKLDNTLDAVVSQAPINSPKSSGKVKSSSVNNSKSTVAQGQSNKRRPSKNDLNSDKNKRSVNEAFIEKEGTQMAVNKEKKSSSTPDTRTKGQLNEANPIAQTNNDNNKSNDSNSLLNNKNINLDSLKGDNNSKIATKEVENKLNDTTKNNSVAKNELEELLNEKEVKLKQESKLNRWQLTSNVAPIFLGSASNGSPIDSTLVNNSKSYNTGVGFGLGVSYAVNKKLTVRTGLNKFNMSYNTNNIVYFAGLESRTLKHINATAMSSMIQIQDDVTNSNGMASEANLLPFENSFVHKNKGYINQEMGYLEMPVELTYALLDKKFGIKIIGGFSTLLLQDNAVNVVSDNRSTFLGEADNLNNIHFSTNFGIGLKYGFMKSFEFNVEPTFKYQLNTFNADSGNFKPYVFGIYSGISYKF
jgi:hypothetical protein